MKEIIKLNKSILEDAGHRIENDGIILTRRGESEAMGEIPDKLKKAIRKLLESLDKAIPDDFGYLLRLGFECPTFNLTYSDGAQSEIMSSCSWDEDESIFEQLDEMDWNGSRLAAISNSQIFDHMKDYAEQLPTRLPATANAQRAFPAEMTAFIESKSGDASKVQVLFWHEENGIEEMSFANIKALVPELADLITCQYRPIAILAEGRPLTIEQIDKLNQDAYDNLRGMPISQAKASCKIFGRPEWDQHEEMS